MNLLPKSSAQGSRQSLNQRVYDHLRSEIVSMQLRPGQPIKEKVYAEKFGISRTPVHEAILRLADDGLVRIYPQSGTFVAPIRMIDVLDARFLRACVEAATVRILANSDDAGVSAKLWEFIEDQEIAKKRRNQELFYELDEAFHAYMIEAAGHPTLWKTINRAKAHLDRVRRLSLPFEDHVNSVMQEHKAIVVAITSGKPNDAEKAISQHLGRNREIVAKLAEQSPELFDPDMAAEK